jgi:hypothetical protein
MTYIPMTYIPMTKASMCRYSYKKSVEISKHFKDNRLQQNNTPLLQQPIAPTCRYFNRPKPLRVDTSTDQNTYVSIFLQTKAPMCRYSYRPKLQCVDIPTDQSSYVSIFLPVFFRLFSGSGYGFLNLERPDPDADPCPHKIVTNFLNYEIFCPQKLCFNHFHEIKVRLHVFLSIHKTF